jgi:WD40 repeat protein
MLTGSATTPSNRWKPDATRPARSCGDGATSFYCLEFSPDGQALACGTEESAWLWDLAGARAVARLQRPAVVRAVAFAPGGDELALAEGRGVTLWQTAAGKARTALEGEEGLVTGVAFTPGGRVLVSGAWGGTVRVWDVKVGQCLAAYQWGIGRVYAVAVSPDGMRAAAAGHEGLVIWDLDDGAS